MIEQDFENINFIKEFLDLKNRVAELERFALTSKGVYADFIELGGVQGDLLPGDVYATNYIYNKSLALHTAVSAGLALPGLRGLWTGASYNRVNPWVRDISGNELHLTGSGIQFHLNEAPCINFGVAGSDTLTRADELNLDIVGNEGEVTSAMKGLTMGCWARPVTVDSTARYIMSKWGTTNQRSYYLAINSSNKIQGGISNAGVSSEADASSANSAVEDTWQFVALDFDPSTYVRVYLNNVYAEDTTSIPATIYSGTSAFDIAHLASANYFEGQLSMMFLCSASLGDDLIKWFYNQTKTLFHRNP
jgi:hypothetical protein